MPTIHLFGHEAGHQVGQTPKALGLNLQWNAAQLASIATMRAKYPPEQSRSALIPILWLAQRSFGGWLSVDAMQLVAETLALPYIRVYEVASFYTMFNLTPVGQHHLQVCTNCACLIRGSDAIVQTIKNELHINHGQTTPDGLFTLTEVECLGACVAAPMMQVNSQSPQGTITSHYFTNLTPQSTQTILQTLQSGASATHLADTSPATPDPITHAEYGT